MWRVTGRLKREGIYICLQLIHTVVQQRLTQHCKSNYIPIKKRKNLYLKQTFSQLLMKKYSLSLLLFSHSVMSNALRPHGLQQAHLPHSSLSPGVYSHSCPLSQGCHPTNSSSVTPFSSCLQSFPASGSFPMSQFFTSGGQSIAASASTSVLPMNIQG